MMGNLYEPAKPEDNYYQPYTKYTKSNCIGNIPKNYLWTIKVSFLCNYLIERPHIWGSKTILLAFVFWLQYEWGLNEVSVQIKLTESKW